MSDNMHDGWSYETRWISNDGRGPLVARCLDERGDVFTFERWNPKAKKPRRVRFKLSLRFLESASCGWVRLPDDAAGVAR